MTPIIIDRYRTETEKGREALADELHRQAEEIAREYELAFVDLRQEAAG